jgi:hypothetical protein
MERPLKGDQIRMSPMISPADRVFWRDQKRMLIGIRQPADSKTMLFTN